MFANKYFAFVLLMAFFATSPCLAKCPLNALNITAYTKQNLKDNKVCVKIADYPDATVELKQSNNIFTGTLGYSTVGFTLFIELSRSYFPKNLHVYVDDKLIKKVTLNPDNLKSYPGKDYNIIYDVQIDLDTSK